MRCWLVLLAACGGGGSQGPRAAEPIEDVGIAIVPQVGYQTWYRATSVCGQGPYEIEVPVAGVKWGEDFELRVATPRRVAITAVILGDNVEEIARTAALFDQNGHGSGKAENMRCVADTKTRLAVTRGGGGAGDGTTVPDVPVGTTIVTPPQPLTVEERVPVTSVEVVHFGWRETGQRSGRIKIRLWSVEPNDLEGVLFGAVRLDWKPNVPEAEYEAHLERERKRLEQERLRFEAEWQQRQTVTVKVDVEKARRDRAEAERRRIARAKAELEEQQRLAIERALEIERQRRRILYCNTHPDSRDCWGAGGKRRHDELDARLRQRDEYCATAKEDVRCWSDAERARRQAIWEHRVSAATEPPKQPDGPPPAPREETPPPKLSENAEWRPGYWLWTGTTWAWLGGMWRVPEDDIVAEKTTVAPVAPPAPRVEEIPPPPVRGTIWVAGFWQWNGSSYIWVAGSYQRPDAGTTWRPAEWRPRGRVHVLIPGAWVPGGRR